MKVLNGSAPFPSLPYPVLTLGNFDGVHLGHQAILRRVVGEAHAHQGTAVVYTFSPHPAKVLAPHSHLPMLQTPAQKSEQIAACGVELLVIEPFTLAFAKISAADFLEKIIQQRIHPAEIIIGYDFTFGVHRSGTTELLASFCASHGIQLSIVEPLFHQETLLSSTHIRLLVAMGNVESAEQMLGRPYEIRGTVERRRGLGKELGIPTANLKPENEVIPAYGVYITQTEWRGTLYPSVTNIGFNPTSGSTPLAIETHILDFTETIAGEKIALSFHQRLREEKRFNSLAELQKAIHHDIAETRAYYAKTRS